MDDEDGETGNGKYGAASSRESSGINSPSGSGSSFGFDTAVILTHSQNSTMLLPDFRPYRISEVSPGQPWPKNLQDLLCRPTGSPEESQRQIPITEIAALLCHAALIEVGYVPSDCETNPSEICIMADPDRIERFGSRVNSSGYNSAASVFAWSYKVVNAASEPVGKDEEKEQETDKEISEVDDEAAVAVVSERNTNYSFSPPCSIIIIPKGVKVQIFCNFSGFPDAKRLFQLSVDVNLQPFMETSLSGLESLRLSPDCWMKCLHFNGAKFSSSFKSSFATHCLDAMNGVMFDLRGLVCLPPEILVRIFSYSDISSIRNARLTCKYLNEVARIPGLWKTLIRRDFGPNPSVPAARFARFLNRIPYELSTNLLDAPNDYRSIFEAQRRYSYRGRLDMFGGLVNRLGGRHSWLPYVTPPRPYLFRFNYDLPPLPSISNADTLFYRH